MLLFGGCATKNWPKIWYRRYLLPFGTSGQTLLERITCQDTVFTNVMNGLGFVGGVAVREQPIEVDRTGTP